MEPDRRCCVVQPSSRANRQREELVIKAKPFDIPKREVWEAFKHVKANQGAAGVDGQSIAEFEADLSNSLYKLWKSAVVRELLSSAGATGGNSESGWRNATVGHSDGSGSRRPGGRSPFLGAACGAGIPCQFLWLQARPIGTRCCAHRSSAVLALRLGARSRHQRLLRQHRLGVVAQGCSAIIRTARGCCSTSSAG